MNCRCGHGRGQHYRVRGKTHLPCHAFVRVERPGVQGTGFSIAPRLVTELCRCRDYVVPGGKTTWGGRTK